MDDWSPPPVRFVRTPSSHFFCTICQRVFSDPVINFACGHSFCRRCLIARLSDDCAFECPADSVVDSVDQRNLVVNRSLQDQINDLDVYCSFGWKWSEDINDFVQDQDGCLEVLKFGCHAAHEKSCSYAWVVCPHGKEKCGSLRRKNIEQHLSCCQYRCCPRHSSGCQFSGTAADLEIHQTMCSFKNPSQTTTSDVRLLQELMTANRALEDQLRETTERTQTLEASKAILENQVKLCLSKIQELSDQQTRMERTLDLLMAGNASSGRQQNGIRHVPSLPSNSESRASASDSREAFTRNWARSSLPSASFGDSTRPNFSHSTHPNEESWVMPFQFKCIGTLRSHKSGVTCLQTSGNKLFSCGTDCVIKVWDLDNLVQGCKMTVSKHKQKIQSLAIGDKFLYSAGEDLVIKSYHLDNLEEIVSVEGAHEKCIAALLCTEHYLFSASYTVIKIWTSRNLSLVHTISGLHHWVRTLACGPSKDKVYSGSHGNIDVWSPTPEFNLMQKITHCHGSVHSLAITSVYIIMGTYNQNMHIYDVKTNDYLHHLMGHVGIINCVVTSNSGKFMFTGSSDSTVLVWSLEKMLPIQCLQRHNDSINALVISGDLLLTGSEDAEIKVFKHFRMQMGFVPS